MEDKLTASVFWGGLLCLPAGDSVRKCGHVAAVRAQIKARSLPLRLCAPTLVLLHFTLSLCMQQYQQQQQQPGDRLQQQTAAASACLTARSSHEL